MNKKMLEKKVQERKAKRETHLNLKGGIGRVTIYTDEIIKHPDPEVKSSGAILLEEGASIGTHEHCNNSEIWVVIEGRVEVNENILEAGQTCICNQNETHYCKNLAKGDSILGFAKKNKAVYD